MDESPIRSLARGLAVLRTMNSAQRWSLHTLHGELKLPKYRVTQNQAIRKPGEPRYLAGLIAFLVSDEAELITGSFCATEGATYPERA